VASVASRDLLNERLLAVDRLARVAVCVDARKNLPMAVSKLERRLLWGAVALAALAQMRRKKEDGSAEVQPPAGSREGNSDEPSHVTMPPANVSEASRGETDGDESPRQVKPPAGFASWLRSSDPSTEPDAVSAAWRRSSDRRSALIGAIAGLVLAYVLGLAALGSASGWFGTLKTGTYVAIGLGAAALLCYFGAAFGIVTVRRRFEQKYVRTVADEAIDELSATSKLTDLMKANRRQMSAYDVIARYQAQSSYRNSQIAMAIGLAILIAGAALAITVQDDTAKIVTASLTAIGAAISGYISKTFLQTYNTTLRQLNYYFEQPLISSYILTAQRLADSVPKASPQMYAELVNGIIGQLIRPSTTSGPAAAAADEKSKPRRRIGAKAAA
jgi:hypothetical protein